MVTVFWYKMEVEWLLLKFHVPGFMSVALCGPLFHEEKKSEIVLIVYRLCWCINVCMIFKQDIFACRDVYYRAILIGSEKFAILEKSRN